MISAKVALSHWNLIFPPNNGVFRMLCLGMEVGDAYSQAIEQILAHPDLSTGNTSLPSSTITSLRPMAC